MFSIPVKEMVREFIDYRELLYRLAWRDVRVKYKQSLMGIGYAIFVPFVQMVLFSVIFTSGVVSMKIPNGIPYAVFAYVGLVPWTLFQTSLTQATTSLTSNSGLVTKIYFPREVFPLSKAMACLLDFGIAFIITFGLMAWYHVPFKATLLLLPAVVLVQTIFTLGLGFFLAIGNLYYRDVNHLVGVTLRVWMFATAVIYPINLESRPRLQRILDLNPMNPIINAYRDVSLYGHVPDMTKMLPIIAASVVLFVTGWIVFHKAEGSFADNI